MRWFTLELVPNIVDPAEPHFERLQREQTRIKEALHSAVDPAAKKQLRKDLRRVRRQSAGGIVKARFRNIFTPW